MKKALVFFVVGIFLVLLAQYFIANSSPFNKGKLQELANESEVRPDDWDSLEDKLNELEENGYIMQYLSTSAYLVFFLLILAVGFFFIVIHLFIDKLFFKEFYEKASIFDAVRRSILLQLAIILAVWLRFSAVKEIYYYLTIPLFFLLTDMLFTVYFKNALILKIGEISQLQKKRKENSKALASKY